MNERIRELAEQAGESIPEFHFGDWNIPNEFIQKFAELIVRECAEISKTYAGGSMPLSIALAIREHFGVKA